LTSVDDVVAGDERVIELAVADTATIAAELESWLGRWIARATE
jgi:hypothetical protein